MRAVYEVPLVSNRMPTHKNAIILYATDMSQALRLEHCSGVTYDVQNERCISADSKNFTLPTFVNNTKLAPKV